MNDSQLPPFSRFRRLRRTPELRRLVREITLDPAHFLFPVFIVAGKDVIQPVESMPGQFRYSVDRLPSIAKEAADLGVGGVLLFGLPESKDPDGGSGLDPHGPVPIAVEAIRSAAPDLVIATDVCLCEYTSHGHCGIVRGGTVENDATLGLLARMAVVHARAGADLLAPSAMMDGQVAAIRSALDREGFHDRAVMGYSAKHASAFYGPFREAAGSAPQFGDRRSYQMDPANLREALREIETDLAEGADIAMVKPGLAYLDVLRAARDRFDAPLAVFNVSGEYAMIKAASAKGWLEERSVVLEILTAFRRAGADVVITYHALEAARWLRE